MVLQRWDMPGSWDLWHHREFLHDAAGLVAAPGSQDEQEEEEGGCCAVPAGKGPGWMEPAARQQGRVSGRSGAGWCRCPGDSAEERLCWIPWNGGTRIV